MKVSKTALCVFVVLAACGDKEIETCKNAFSMISRVKYSDAAEFDDLMSDLVDASHSDSLIGMCEDEKFNDSRDLCKIWRLACGESDTTSACVYLKSSCKTMSSVPISDSNSRVLALEWNEIALAYYDGKYADMFVSRSKAWAYWLQMISKDSADRSCPGLLRDGAVIGIPEWRCREKAK